MKMTTENNKKSLVKNADFDRCLDFTRKNINSGASRYSEGLVAGYAIARELELWQLLYVMNIARARITKKGA
jgi:hypothetical protein